MVYTHNGILISHKVEWAIGICQFTDDRSQNNYAEEKKSDKKRMHTQWFHLHKNSTKCKLSSNGRKWSAVTWGWGVHFGGAGEKDYLGSQSNLLG